MPLSSGSDLGFHIDPFFCQNSLLEKRQKENTSPGLGKERLVPSSFVLILLGKFYICGSVSGKGLLNLLMRKLAFCICKNKDADQLRGNREADQCLCFRYTDKTIPILTKSEISSLLPYSIIARPGLCRSVGNPKDQFSHVAAHL